jgi:molybdopterin/thiamine biosynthesis adenylyltransferase
MGRRTIDQMEKRFSVNLDEERFYEDIFLRTNLLLKKKDQERLRNSSVATIGLGGIGGMSAEMIVRCGIGTVGLADIDFFEPTNLNRQLYSDFSNAYGPNHRSLDKKGHVAEARMKQINPFCKVEVIANGINNQNVEDFCKKQDVIIAQPDRESIKVLIHRIAKKHSIPVVTSSRVNCNGNRWTIAAKVWDYKNNPGLKTFEETNHPALLKYSLEELTSDVLGEYDKQDKAKVRNRWKEIIENQESEKYGLNCHENSMEVLNKYPDTFHKCHIIAPIANIAGAMGSINAIKLLLDQPIYNFAFDFWNGNALEI